MKATRSILTLGLTNDCMKHPTNEMGALWDNIGNVQFCFRHNRIARELTGGCTIFASLPTSPCCKWWEQRRVLGAGYTLEQLHQAIARLHTNAVLELQRRQLVEALYREVPPVLTPEQSQAVEDGELAGHVSSYDEMSRADVEYWATVLGATATLALVQSGKPDQQS